MESRSIESVLQFDCSVCFYVMSCRKVEQVAEEAESLKESLDKYFLRNQRRINEARERAELLGRAVCLFSFR